MQHVDDAAAINHGFAVIENKRRHLAHRAVATNLLFIGVGVEVEMLERNAKQFHRDSSPARKSRNPRANKLHHFLHAAGSVKASERFFERADIQLLRPGGGVLEMELPISLGDRLGIEHAVLAELLEGARKQRSHPVAVDRAIDDDVRNMNTLWSELARHALRDHAQTRLARGEMGKARHAAKR